MRREVELLAPGGEIDSIKAALLAGANAIYCGLDKFNARNRAANISFDDLQGILRLAHKNDCQVFLTLNIVIVESEIPALIVLLNKLINTSIDGLIIQDLGLFYILSNYYKGFKIHASTQLTTHNSGQIKFLSKLTANRVNLSRELNIDEIRELAAVGHQNNVLTEVFVHGSNCISFSGLCYISSVHGGNSGNRGRCSQPCRDGYVTTLAGKDFPLNLKDNSAYLDLEELYEAGVASLKIEGRIKKFHYVYSVVESWRKQLDRLYTQQELNKDKSELYKVFNRDFSNTFLKGDIHKDMFIDNPRDHSAIHLAELNHGGISDENLEIAKKDVYDERTGIINDVRSKIEKLHIAKAPLVVRISGKSGELLKVAIQTPEASFEVHSESHLVNKDTQSIDRKMILKRFKVINDTEYFIQELNVDQLDPGLFLSFKELTAIKREILFLINNSRKYIDPIDTPVLEKRNKEKLKPTLSVLISDVEDVYLCKETSSSVYFQLPNCFKHNSDEFVDLFINNPDLVPWFPAVMIGDDYTTAIRLLEKVKPNHIVTNNTGIAYEAYESGIRWIAGPQLNIVNSYSLQTLKDNFNCSGAFISNEISKSQMQYINKPDNFELYYSVYHPIVLMTSRQCLFHQVTG
ncbi:MAG: DUF3656 domain-containing protein, partial [Bacteroidales bacterium]|nr:DUF3656 domain-containing protein [Bacteroidales bacterium]